VDVLQTSDEMRTWSRACRRKGETIAFVPTMGYLHQGHLSLVEGAKERADRVVASVYVNPGQFAPHEDFDTYPRDPQGDRKKLRLAGCDAVFEPTSLYTEGHQTWVRAEELEVPLCGVSRPTFFRGVATVVTKLFHIVGPDVAVFGKKDYQQWRIIETLSRELDFGIEVVGMPLVREADGLAMSSRNARLSVDDRVKARSMSEALFDARRRVEDGLREAAILRENIRRTITDVGGVVDYVEIVSASSLLPVLQITDHVVIAAAASFGGVRLIDNVEIGV
jgi:pantoate--beta-alanine ligase